MAEPGTVTGTITQSNPQGLTSNNAFPSINVSALGTDSLQVNPTTGGVGFSGDTVVDSTQGTGATGENDEVNGDEFQQEQIAMGKTLFDMDNLPESPYYKYHIRELSSGNDQKDQKRHGDRSLGRGMNMNDIRNGSYYANHEADIFTWDLSATKPNITKQQVENNEIEDLRDV